MKSIVRLFLLLVIFVFSFFIVSTTHGEKIMSPFVAVTPTPTHYPFPLFTIKPIPTAAPTPTPQPVLTGFCLPVPVLMYHHIENMDQAVRENHAFLTVDPDIFEEQMKYLKENGYQTISAETLITALINKQPLSSKSIVITLDDGYDDIFENAYPIAKNYGVTLNLMISSGLMENAGYLQWSQLQTMVSSGLIKVYNHTWSHSSLTSDTKEKIISEITTAQTQLEQRFGSIPKIFSYPYGNYDTNVISILQNQGYTAAFSTIQGTTQCDSILYSLPRIRAGNQPLSSYRL